ncbi:MAG TPA: DUF2059 domain-containing protein [Devosiaceae bacterium]
MIRTSHIRPAIIAVVAAVALVPAIAAQAQDNKTPAPATVAQEVSPDQLALAHKYVELTDTAKVFENTMGQTAIETMRTVMRTNPDIGEKAKNAITKVLDSYIPSKNDLMDKFARVYALRFTKDELQQIVDFYSSDVGKKLSAQNKAINSELEAVLTVFRNNLRTEFYAKVKAELEAEGVKL